MKINNIFKLFALSIFLITSCSDDDSGPSFQSNVLVINEGNFLSAEGSITGFNSSTGEVEADLYQSTNGFAIAATIQQVETFENEFFITCNNPDKLEVINSTSLMNSGTISEGLATPYAFAGSGDTGFVTNWGTYNSETYGYDDPFIAVVDLSDLTISSTIPCDYKPQDLLVLGGKLYVSNVNSNSITVMDIATLEVVASIETPAGPDKMELDAAGDIWVICTSGNLVKIDVASNEVVKTIENVPTSGFNEKMVLNSDKSKIYFLSTTYDADWVATSNVFEISTTASIAPSTPIVSSASFYGIGVDGEVLYVGDHNNYQGNGTVFRYTLDGEEIDNFESGINPNGFIFR
ncbi:YncE family protein [Fulvivirga lutimaris]|uniref:YncE family protein n=1 Tax=Fulvivirga lutimaris TaxID=1819566 RepID=UPI0016298440|nr:DUF5074 domain-containing protein [Fulvivirga lutimaris]